MGLLDFLNKEEPLVAIDIGAGAVKLIELDITQEKPKLVNVGLVPISNEVFSNNVISKSEYVSEQINSLLESNGIQDRRVVTGMPGPSVFTKKIQMPKMELSELNTNIQFEAGNFIPHNVDAVRLDYHIIGESGKNKLDILVVAVKNEIIDSFIDCLALAGLEAAVVDVDYFALQNIYEVSYPEQTGETVALINLGARFTSINIVRDGDSLFTGDINVGGKLFTDAIESEMSVSTAEAEAIKLGKNTNIDADQLRDIVDRNIEYVASEFNRQLSFFWNASGAEEGIDKIMLTGGGSLVGGLKDELSEKTGLECDYIDPFRNIECGEGFDPNYLRDIAPLMSVCIGMAIRQPGDKVVPEFDA